MKIEVHGDDEVILSLEKYTSTEKLIGAVQRACAVVEAAAKKKAPKRSGDLRRSINSKVEADSSDIKGIVFTPLEYAPYVEFGTGLFAEDGGRKDVPWNYKDDKGIWHSTSGQNPQPYLRPALEENREKILRMIKEGFSND